MLVPNANRAIVDIRKLRDYCLDASYPEGKHKARLFLAALKMSVEDADDLRRILLEVVQIEEAVLGRHDAFGQRYTLDFLLEWKGRRAIVRSGWMIEHGSLIPRLTTCFPR
jgi:hypothetical protein